jgi:CheY-like chemotaxis protein
VLLKVLLADDSVPAQNMGKKILVDAGYDVLTASNGLDALRKINEAPPDIAILDIFMPGYSGLELCARLRGATPTAALPVILTVGKMEPYRSEDGEQVKSNAVIIKPFAAAELISAVRSLIGESSVPPPAPAVVDPNHISATGEPFEDVTYADGDEPLPLLESAAAGLAEPSTDAGQSIYTGDDEPLFTGVESSGAESTGAESLAYNPDAVRTPFSASVVDFLPSISNFQEADKESPLGEFDLTAEPSPAAPGAESSNAEEPLLAAPEALQTKAPEAPSPAYSAPSPLEWEASPLGVPPPDPLLEEETDAAVPEPSEAPQATIAHEGATNVDPVSTASAAPPAEDEEARRLALDEEARRLAFEELFNSTEPLPLDESPASLAEVPPAEAEPAPAQFSHAESSILPSMANLSHDHPFDVALDSEIEPLTKDSHDEFVSEPDPYLMEELEPMNAVGDIPGRDVMLDRGIEPTLEEIRSLQQPLEAPAPALSLTHEPPEVLSQLTPPELDSIPAEAEPLAEVAPAALEAMSAAPEPVEAEVAELVPELAPVHVEPKASEAVELATEPKATPVELAPEPTSEPLAAESELAPAQIAVEHEPTPEPIHALAPPAMVAEVAHSAMEAHAENILSSPELDSHSLEVERVRQAVDRVFDRFKRLLVNAVVRELNRRD